MHWIQKGGNLSEEAEKEPSTFPVSLAKKGGQRAVLPKGTD